MKAVVRWITPWAALGRSGADYAAPADADGAWRWIGGGALWLCVPNGTTISVDGGKPDYRLVMRLADQRSVFAIALPSRPSAGLVLSAGGTTWRLALPAIPDRPHEADEPTSENERAASALLARVKAVWARVRDIELCLADPATIWPRLRARWLDPTTLDPPMMDVIVRHARTLARTLALLHRAPRRVLRRRNSELPLDGCRRWTAVRCSGWSANPATRGPSAPATASASWRWRARRISTRWRIGCCTATPGLPPGWRATTRRGSARP